LCLEDGEPGRRRHEEVVALSTRVVAVETRDEPVVQGGAVVGILRTKSRLLNEFAHEAIQACA